MADVHQPSPEEVQKWLVQFLTPKTALIQEATVWLKQYLKMPFSIPVMFQILLVGNKVQTRQTAGVLLRSWLVKHWASVDEDVAINMKNALLQAFAVEPEIVLRRAMSDLVTLIARLTLPLDHWPEFWPAMFEMANSGNDTQKISLLGVIEDLGDKIFELMRPQLPDLLPFVHHCLQNTEDPHVRVAAMKAIGTLMGEVNEEQDELVEKLKPFVPLMLELIEFCVHQGADMEANDGLCIFQAMVETCPSILSPHVSAITHFCLLTASNTGLEWEVRSECLTFLEWVIQFRPSFIIKQHLLDPILDVCFSIASEPDMEGVQTWEITPHRFAMQIVDCLCSYIKPKHTFRNIMARVDAWMVSENPWERRTAISAISAMPKGCVEEMLKSLEEYFPYMEAAFNDQESVVRQAGCIMLSQFADFLSPPILEHYEFCLPLAYKALCEEDPEIQERALFSLIAFMEHLDHSGVESLLPDIIQRLVNLLETSDNKDIQDSAISAIAACASAALEQFTPFWEHIVKMLQQLMDVTGELIPLRARALDCVGVISMAVGKDVFAPYFDYFMNKALESYHMQNDEPILREMAINFFGNAAEALQQDFAPYFETALGLILESLTNVDGAQPELDDSNRAMAQLMVDSDDDDDAIDRNLGTVHDDEDRLPGELTGLHYVTNQGLVEEKTVALQALGTFAHAMGPLFVPHIARCMEVLDVTATYVHPKVRSFTIYPMETFVHCINLAYPPANPWVLGSNPEAHPLAPESQEFASNMIEMFLKRIVADFDLGVVARYVEGITFIMNTLGAPALYDHMPAVAAAILKVLHMETVAHVMETDNGDGENEEIAHELLLVFDNACDFIIALAKQYQSGFGIWFPLLEGLIKHLTVDGELSADDGSERYRQEAVGALAEVTEACTVHAFSPEQVRVLLAQGIKSLSDPHESTRCNAIYLLRLVTLSPESFDWWQPITNIVVPLLADEDDQTVDNANGCIASMIQTNPSLLPMTELLPAWLEAFPVRTDQIESTFAYGTLMNLLEHASQDIFPHIPTAFKILVDSLGSPVITEETRVRVTATLKSLWSQFSAELQPVLETLDEDGNNNLQTALA